MNLSIIRIVALSASLVINIMNAGVHQDLELFPPKATMHGVIDGQDNVAEKLDRTLTTVGKTALHALLKEPTTDIAALRDRQDIMRYLLTHKLLTEALTLRLAHYAQSEKAFNAGLQKIDALSSSAVQGLYYQTGAVNHLLQGKLDALFTKLDASPTALAVGVFIDLGAVATSVITHYGMALIAYAAGKKINTHAGCVHGHGHAHAAPASNGVMNVALGALTAVHSFEAVPATVAVVNWLRKTPALLKALQATLIPVAQQIACMHNIYTLLSQYPEVAQKLSHFKDLEALCTRKCSDKLKKLLNILEANTFTGEPSMFSHLGNVLAAHKLLQEVGNELQPALDAIGEVDTYLGLATLMHEHTEKPTKYSFATYQTALTPHIEAVNFWHPLIPAETTVLNSVTFGKNDQRRNALLTADNERGKTATLKSIAVGAYLAQTIGIVPAASFELTPFASIETSIILEDNLSQKQSSYRAARNRADAIEDVVEKYAGNGHVLVIQDEPFQRTNAERGLNEASVHLAKLGNEPHVICVASSHFKELPAALAQQNFANLTVRERKLVPGIGDFAAPVHARCSKPRA